MPQAPAKPTTEEIRQMQVTAGLDEAVKISEDYETLLKRRKANRVELRGLLDMGHVTDDDDVALINELYPARERRSPEEAAKAAAEALKRAQERATKAQEAAKAATKPDESNNDQPAK